MALTAQQKAAGRKPFELITEIAKIATGNAALSVVVADATKGTFTGEIQMTVDGAPAIYKVANADGRLKSFNDVDSFIIAVMNGLGQRIAGELTVKMVGASSLIKPPKVITDIIADAERRLAKLQTAQTAQAAALARVTAEVALSASWETGTPAEQARYQELLARKAAVEQYNAYLQAEIIRINAIINP